MRSAEEVPFVGNCVCSVREDPLFSGSGNLCIAARFDDACDGGGPLPPVVDRVPRLVLEALRLIENSDCTP